MKGTIWFVSPFNPRPVWYAWTASAQLVYVVQFMNWGSESRVEDVLGFDIYAEVYKQRKTARWTVVNLLCWLFQFEGNSNNPTSKGLKRESRKVETVAKRQVWMKWESKGLKMVREKAYGKFGNMYSVAVVRIWYDMIWYVLYLVENNKPILLSSEWSFVTSAFRSPTNLLFTR